MIAAIAELFFSTIAAITAIIVSIWKPGLSYASYSGFFFFRNEKGLLSFVSERIKLVYRINNTRYNFPKNKLPFKHLKPQFIGRILLNYSPYLNINY